MPVAWYGVTVDGREVRGTEQNLRGASLSDSDSLSERASGCQVTGSRAESARKLAKLTAILSRLTQVQVPAQTIIGGST